MQLALPSASSRISTSFARTGPSIAPGIRKWMRHVATISIACGRKARRVRSIGRKTKMPRSLLRPRRLLHRAHRKPGDEAVEEYVVEQRDRHARDQARRHQRSPEVHVAPHQKNGNAHPHHLLRFRRNERQRVNKFLRHQRKRENHYCEDSGSGNRNHQLHERAEARQPIDHRGVFQFLRYRFKESHQQPDREGNGKARINEHHGPDRVLQSKNRHDARQGNEQQRRWNQIREKNRDSHSLAPASSKPRERVSSRDGQKQRDDHNDYADQRRISEPAHVACFEEQQLQVIERGREIELEGIVLDRVEVDVLLERGDQHPVKRKRQQHHERRQRCELRSAGTEFAPIPSRHYVTSARCAARSMKYAIRTRTGMRNNDIAAPAAKSLSWLPVADARQGSVCVESNGPPAVRMYTTVMSVKVKIVPNSTATLMMGAIIGMLMRKRMRQNPAPSMAAASGMSLGIAVSPASMMTVENGIRRQQWTRITDAIANFGSPSHIGAPYGL